MIFRRSSIKPESERLILKLLKVRRLRRIRIAARLPLCLCPGLLFLSPPGLVRLDGVADEGCPEGDFPYGDVGQNVTKELLDLVIRKELLYGFLRLEFSSG